MPTERGAFTLSLDVELAWGSWRRGSFSMDTFAGDSRMSRRLDERCRELRLPATWAIVGAMFGLRMAELEAVDPETSVAALRPRLGPYDDPLPTVGHVLAAPDAFLDPGLVHELSSSAAGHEIGTHTYFHANPTTASGMVADVTACRAATPPGSPVRTIVYPRDAVRHVSALPAAEIDQYRTPGAARYFQRSGKPSGWGRVAHTLDQFVGRPAPLVELRPDTPVAVPSSGVLTLRYGVRRRIPIRSVRRRYVRPLDQAVRTGGVYHLYTHPWNLALPGSDAFELLGDVLDRAVELRDRGDLDVLTIDGLAAPGAARSHGFVTVVAPAEAQVIVTGGAGFIGANLCRELMRRGVGNVVVVDDLSTGARSNLATLPVTLLEGTILDAALLDHACEGASAIVHLAARPSVPRSLRDPVATHEANATGTLRVLEAARRCGAAVILASSSSVYGRNPALPKHEDLVPMPVSPYAVSKLAAESYALAYGQSFGVPTLALRFFNVFGPLQAAGHAYAAVIPSFLDAALAGRPLVVHGDGMQTRDFTFVDTVTEVLATAALERVTADWPVNLAFGTRTSLLEVIAQLEDLLGHRVEVQHSEPRPGDVRDSQADNTRLRGLFPYIKPVEFRAGLAATLDWFRAVAAAV